MRLPTSTSSRCGPRNPDQSRHHAGRLINPGVRDSESRARAATLRRGQLLYQSNVGTSFSGGRCIPFSWYSSQIEVRRKKLERVMNGLRGLIDAMVLTPDQDELQIELRGNLAAMLGAAQNAKSSPDTGDLMVQIKLVAGTPSCLYRPRSLSLPRDSGQPISRCRTGYGSRPGRC